MAKKLAEKTTEEIKVLLDRCEAILTEREEEEIEENKKLREGISSFNEEQINDIIAIVNRIIKFSPTNLGEK